MKRLFLLLAETLLWAMLDAATAGLAWLDSLDPDPDLDELEREFEDPARPPRRLRVTVSLPRHPSRRMH